MQILNYDRFVVKVTRNYAIRRSLVQRRRFVADFHRVGAPIGELTSCVINVHCVRNAIGGRRNDFQSLLPSLVWNLAWGSSRLAVAYMGVPVLG